MSAPHYPSIIRTPPLPIPLSSLPFLLYIALHRYPPNSPRQFGHIVEPARLYRYRWGRGFDSSYSSILRRNRVEIGARGDIVDGRFRGTLEFRVCIEGQVVLIRSSCPISLE
jgi:hypothetical protein